VDGREVHPPPHREGERIEPVSRKGGRSSCDDEGLADRPPRLAPVRGVRLRQRLLRTYDRLLWLERETAVTGGPLTPRGQPSYWPSPVHRVPGLPGDLLRRGAQGRRQGSSDPLEQAVIRGLAERGANVIDLGTPRHGKVDLHFHLAVDCGLWHETSGVRNRQRRFLPE
jgi:hypothetical protein